MSWTDWIAKLFDQKPNYWETLYRDEKSLSDKYFYQNQTLVSEIARLKSDLSLAIDQISKLNASVKSLEKRNQSLQGQLMVADTYGGITNSLSKKLEDAENELNETSAIVGDLKVQLEIANNKLAATPDITPAILQERLKSKYPEGSDVAKVWDEYELALINAFAVTQNDDPVAFSSGDMRNKIVEAFPGVPFHSAAKDDEYYATTIAMAEKIIRNDYGNLKVYVPHKRDCDKFAQKLRVHFWDVYGYTVAVEVWGNSPYGFHSWIIVVCSDGILMVEPQSDMISQLPISLSAYQVTAIHDW